MVRAYKALPPASELWELFDYKPLTGELVWNRRIGVRTGAEAAGSLDKDGYLRTTGEKYLVHRVIWKWVTGSDPLDGYTVDHQDRQRLNNRWANLRLATESQQRFNTCVRRDSSTGVKGVFPYKSSGRYYSKIKVRGRVHYLGVFKTVDEARMAYEKASLKLHGEFSTVLR